MPEPQSTRRAVIVEDNDDIRGLLVQIISGQGFETVEAATGSEGLDLVRADGADLITLDLNLPDMDGIEVCRRVREFSDAYLLMITARADELHRLEGLETGADDYISKPFSPRELAARITALFRRPRTQPSAVVPGEDEQRRAAEVQRSLLPSEPLLLDGYEIGGNCRPARSVGGDFFDWYPTPDGLQLTLADAMGKGMGAALIAATVRAVLRSSAAQADLDAAFRAAGRELERDLEQSGSFATVFHARLDARRGRLDYVDAGHGLGLYLGDGKVSRLPSGGPPVGALPGSTWRSNSVELAPGEAVLIASDGLLDAFDSVPEAVAAVREAVAQESTAQGACDAVLRLAGPDAAADDVTAVMVRRADGGSAPA